MIVLESCPKGYTKDGDKAVTPAETVARVCSLEGLRGRVLKETRRIDSGRLGIPVFLSVCGDEARSVMPTRKQMGKGASPEQAEASALMELVERFSFFSFWADPARFVQTTWSEAEARWPETLLPIEQVLASVGERLDPDQARTVLDLVPWRFCPATDLTAGREVMVPLDWFKKLGEFNGSSAGNTQEESLLQGGCELVERHVCAILDRERPVLPTIDPESFADPVLKDLHRRFTDNGVLVVLKDCSMSMPVPTIVAVAWDPSTFPELSEVVLTAGTAATPVKAAVRALTEVAQLAGDFETGAVYEASGLHKPESPEDAAWLLEGDTVALDTLPSVESSDIQEEFCRLVGGLEGLGFRYYAVDISHPEFCQPAHYSFAPGFQFRERDVNASLGLFVGRTLAEDMDPLEALDGLDVLEEIYGKAHFIPFFRAMTSLRLEDPEEASRLFAESLPLQPDPDSRGLAAFYAGYALTLLERWEEAEPWLGRAMDECPEMKEYCNLRGVARYKLGRYPEAAEDFRSALKLDKGSAVDLANLGACHRFMGETEQAREYLESALELDPSLAFAETHLEALGEMAAEK